MSTLSKKQVIVVAHMHSSIHLNFVDDSMFEEVSDLDEEDKESIIKEIKSLADKLSLGQPMNLGTTGDIVKYVKNKFP